MTTTTDFIPAEWGPAIHTSENSMVKLNKAYREHAVEAALLYSLLEKFGGEPVAPARFTVNLSEYELEAGLLYSLLEKFGERVHPARFTVDLSHVVKVIPSEDVVAVASEKANG